MSRSLVSVVSITLLAFLTGICPAGPAKVTLDPERGLLRNGEPFFVKGAGAQSNRIASVAEHGGNAIRTWSERDQDKNLDAAAAAGLMMASGLWIEPECNWFSYNNPENCNKQAERIRGQIRKHRDHPALLAWGLGNEAEGDGKNPAFWKQIDRLAKLAKEEDPNHPTFTAVAGLSQDKARGLDEFAPHLDFIGINTYGALSSLRQHLAKIGWKRPWMLTEYGARGFWEQPKTPWNAPLEQTSSEKARQIREAARKTITPGGGCLGGFVFLWGQKQEGSATWFGLFTAAGESTEPLDVVHELWTGHPPADRAPEMKSLKSDAAGKNLAPGAEFTASADAADPEGVTLTWRWEIAPETGKRDADGAALPISPLPGLVKSGAAAQATLTAPARPGAYRVFVFALDGTGRAATANFPIQVGQ